jgi:hypothetical protein
MERKTNGLGFLDEPDFYSIAPPVQRLPGIAWNVRITSFFLIEILT